MPIGSIESALNALRFERFDSTSRHPARIEAWARRRGLVDGVRAASCTAVIVGASAFALWRSDSERSRIGEAHGAAVASRAAPGWAEFVGGVAPAILLVAAVGLIVSQLRRGEIRAIASAREGRRRAIAAARRLAESERRFRTLADGAPMLIWSCDATGRVDFVSRPWSNLVGRAPEQDMGDGWLQALHPEDRERCRRDLRSALREHRAYTAEYRIRRTTGEVRHVLNKAVPRRDDAGAFGGFIGAAVDVTELRRTEADLAEACRVARAAEHAKSEFLANMSHEIRTPLTTILGYADLLREDGDASRAPPQRIQAIDRIRSAGRHLLTIINDVLDLSKIDAGAMRVECVEFDLPELLAESLDLLRGSASQRGLELRFEPMGALPVRVRTDPTRLRQILLNLLANAVKFTSQGGVTLRCGVDEGRLTAEVEDTGCGMTGEQAERLFQAFAQGDASVARMHGGTGLGLAISRRLASLMHGTVSIARTAPGAGTCFRVVVRAEVPANSPQIASTEAFESHLRGTSHEPEAGSARRLSGRVLLAEDGRENRQLITIHLERAGAQVTTAEDGRTALSLLDEARRLDRPFDLLVTDLQMPEMDGISLIERIRRTDANLPIVVLTAHAVGDERERCRRAGCNDFATKPIERAAFIAACARWLDRRASDAARYPRACTTSACSRPSPPRSWPRGSSA